jgi:hypothetical protein
MFQPSISRDQQDQVSNLLQRLKQAEACSEPTELLGLRAKRREVSEAISSLQNSTEILALESVASRIATLRVQLEIVDGRIESARQAWQEIQSTQAGDRRAILARASSLLAEIAFDFIGQHRANVEAFLEKYCPGQTALPNNVTRLLPFFSQASVNADSLRNHRMPHERVMVSLEAAASGRDFLML